jgi:hypothetical protein
MLRRRTSRRRQLVEQSTATKNSASAVLVRNLKRRPELSDLFGKAGRAWLEALELPQSGASWTDLEGGPGSRAPRARRGSLVGCQLAGPAAGLRPAHRGAARHQHRHGRRRAQAVRAQLAPPDPRRGLRLRPPLARAAQAAHARTARRRPTPQARTHHRTGLGQEGRRQARARVGGASRGELSAARQRVAGEPAVEAGRGRDTGARIFKAVCAASSAADLQAPAACALARRSPAPQAHSRKGACSRQPEFDFHP